MGKPLILGEACSSPGDTVRRQLNIFTDAQWETLSSRKLICIGWQTVPFPGMVVLLLLKWVECLLVCNSLANSSRQGRMWARKGWVPKKVENTEESCKPPVVKNTHLDLFMSGIWTPCDMGVEEVINTFMLSCMRQHWKLYTKNIRFVGWKERKLLTCSMVE